MNASSSDHQTGWTSNQERTYSSVDAEGDYTYYKIQFTQAEGTDSYLGFREIDLIGVDYTPVPDFNLALTLDENNATLRLLVSAIQSVSQTGKIYVFKPWQVQS